MKKWKNPFKQPMLDLTPQPGPKRRAKMKADTRECGWLGCGNPLCEPFCKGIAR